MTGPPPPSIGDFVPELLCLGVDAIIASIIFGVYKATKNTIKDIKDAPVLDLPLEDGESFGKIVRNHPGCVASSQVGTRLPYAVVRGNVVPKERSLPPHLSTQIGGSDSKDDNSIRGQRLEGVVRTQTLIEHKKNLSRAGFWYDSERVIQSHSNQVPFCLVAPALQEKLSSNDVLWQALGGQKVSSKSGLEVTDWAQAVRFDMEVTKDNFEAAPSGVADHVWGWVEGEKQLGLQNKECMLLNGTTITAIGEIIVNENDSVKIQEPTSGGSYFLIKDTVKELIQDYEEGCRGLKLTLALFGGIGTAIACYAGYKYYRKRQEYLEATANHRLLDEIITARSQRMQSDPVDLTSEGSGDNSSGGNNCVVCLGRQREVILLPCSHVCMCADCAREIMSRDKTCPVCRAEIERVAPAFIS